MCSKHILRPQYDWECNVAFKQFNKQEWNCIVSEWILNPISEYIYILFTNWLTEWLNVSFFKWVTCFVPELIGVFEWIGCNIVYLTIKQKFLSVNLKLADSWQIQCFWKNWLTEWFNDWLNKAVTCFVPEWIRVFEQISDWMIQWLT